MNFLFVRHFQILKDFLVRHVKNLTTLHYNKNARLQMSKKYVQHIRA